MRETADTAKNYYGRCFLLCSFVLDNAQILEIRTCKDFYIFSAILFRTGSWRRIVCCFHCLPLLISARCASDDHLPRIQAAWLLTIRVFWFEPGEDKMVRLQWWRCNHMQGPHLNTNIRNYWFHHVFFYATSDCRLGFQHSGYFCGQFLHPVRDALWCCWIFRKSHTPLSSECSVFIFLWIRILLYLLTPKLSWYPDLDIIDSLSGIFLDFPPK